MSLRRRLLRVAVAVLDEHAPGAADALQALDAWASGRAPIEAPTAGPVSPDKAQERDDEGDTLVVEITDERGRFVGYTTAKMKE